MVIVEKMKPLEEKLKKMNEGVLSVELVEAPESKLPAKIESPINSGTGSELSEDIMYMCMQASIKPEYVSKLEGKLKGVLVEHDFISKENHYERVREGIVDYLFLNGFMGKEGTYGISVKTEEHREFENLLSEPCMVKESLIGNVSWGGIFGLLAGATGGIIAGLAAGLIQKHTALLGDNVSGGDIFLMTTLGCAVLGSLYGAGNRYLATIKKNRLSEENYKKSMMSYEEAKEKFRSSVDSSNEKYDHGIMNKFLDLTPGRILSKSIGSK